MIHLINYKDYNDSLTTMIREQLMQKLEEGKSRNELIYIPEGIRGIGKTTILIEFAKKYGYAVIVYRKNRIYNYEHIYEYGDIIRANNLLNINYVVDEGVYDSLNKSKELINIEQLMMFKILTGYTNNWCL
jgi:hypothetical protein